MSTDDLDVMEEAVTDRFVKSKEEVLVLLAQSKLFFKKTEKFRRQFQEFMMSVPDENHHMMSRYAEEWDHWTSLGYAIEKVVWGMKKKRRFDSLTVSKVS